MCDKKNEKPLRAVNIYASFKWLGFTDNHNTTISFESKRQPTEQEVQKIIAFIETLITLPT